MKCGKLIIVLVLILTGGLLFQQSEISSLKSQSITDAMKNNEIAFNLQRKCAQDAIVFYNNSKDPGDKYSFYYVHYNNKLNACIIEISERIRNSGVRGDGFFETVYNLYESSLIAEFNQYASSKVPIICQVGKTQCATHLEFDTLIEVSYGLKPNPVLQP